MSIEVLYVKLNCTQKLQVEYSNENFRFKKRPLRGSIMFTQLQKIPRKLQKVYIPFPQVFGIQSFHFHISYRLPYRLHITTSIFEFCEIGNLVILTESILILRCKLCSIAITIFALHSYLDAYETLSKRLLVRLMPISAFLICLLVRLAVRRVR